MRRGSGIHGLLRGGMLERLAFGAVGALARRRARDHYVGKADARRARGGPPRERVLEKGGIVAFRAAGVETLVRAARFAPRVRRMRHRLRHIQLEAELDRAEPFRV